MKTTISNTISTLMGDIVAYLGFLREQGYYLSLCRLDPLFASCMNDFCRTADMRLNIVCA